MSLRLKWIVVLDYRYKARTFAQFLKQSVICNSRVYERLKLSQLFSDSSEKVLLFVSTLTRP